MRFLLILTVFTSLVCVQYSSPGTADGQVLGKTLHDYWLDKPFNYRPSDPWVRGKTFQIQTGHYGRFYNCDDEECKRNSPYICWKTHYEKDIPTPRGFWGGIKQDWSRVTQRIRDGACLGDDCNCNDCENQDRASTSPCTCKNCLQETQQPRRQITVAQLLNISRSKKSGPEISKRKFGSSLTNILRADSPPFQQPAQSTPRQSTPRFGLVSGRSFDGAENAVHAAPIIETFSAPTARVARIAKLLSRKK